MCGTVQYCIVPCSLWPVKPFLASLWRFDKGQTEGAGNVQTNKSSNVSEEDRIALSPGVLNSRFPSHHYTVHTHTHMHAHTHTHTHPDTALLPRVPQRNSSLSVVFKFSLCSEDSPLVNNTPFILAVSLFLFSRSLSSLSSLPLSPFRLPPHRGFCGFGPGSQRWWKIPPLRQNSGGSILWSGAKNGTNHFTQRYTAGGGRGHAAEGRSTGSNIFDWATDSGNRFRGFDLGAVDSTRKSKGIEMPVLYTNTCCWDALEQGIKVELYNTKSGLQTPLG